MTLAQDYQNLAQSFTFTIGASATSSAAQSIGGLRPALFLFTEAITGGSITFTASADGTNYYALRAITGSLAAITATSIGLHALNADYQTVFQGVSYLSVARAASSGSAQTVTVLCRPASW